MNKNAKRWVKALKSGKYKQTKGVLRDEKGFCCLGVACELACKSGIIKKKSKKKSVGKRYYYGSKIADLPKKVMDWLGLTDVAGTYRAKGRDTSLATRNDDGATFQEIAKIIESNPKWLFKDEN